MEYELMINNLCGTWHHHTSRPYFSLTLICYDAVVLQVHDQMMIDIFLRPSFLAFYCPSPCIKLEYELPYTWHHHHYYYC
jgi:hypothetical protein